VIDPVRAEADHDGDRGPAVHLPAPTIWPVVCGAGVALMAFGLLTHLAFSVLGLLLLARSLVGWFAEMRDE
jgi:hypothetical protein